MKNFEPVTKVKIGHRIEFEPKPQRNSPLLLALIAALCGLGQKMSPTFKWSHGFPSLSLAFPCQTSLQRKFLFRNGIDPPAGQLMRQVHPIRLFRTLKGDKHSILIVKHNQVARSNSLVAKNISRTLEVIFDR